VDGVNDDGSNGGGGGGGGGVTVAIPLPSSPIFAPSAVPSVTLPPTGDVVSGRVGDDGGDGDGGDSDSGGGEGGSDPHLLPLPP